MKFAVVLLLILASAVAGAQSYSSPFKNIQNIAKELQFFPYYKLVPQQQVKIAIFDGGFADLEKAKAEHNLPSDLIYKPGTIPLTPNEIETPHGTIMAELIYALMTLEGNAPQFAPQLYLYRVNGYTNFKEAIKDAITNGVQIISYSEVRDFGSNWDGHGFWNEEVDRATKAGIIWVNSAGNFAHLTYTTPVQFTEKGIVKLPDTGNGLSLVCQTNPPYGDKCPIKIYLTWNDFKNDPNLGTKKDLDFSLVDDQGKTILESDLQQVQTVKEGGPGKSLYPREYIEGTINKGRYFIKVKSRAPENFEAQDQLRVEVDADFITLNHYDVTENLLNPADNPNVITVGASDHETTSVSLKLHKPELKTASSLVLKTGSEYRGNSNSTAMVSAGLGLLKSIKPELDRAAILNLVSSPSENVRLQIGPKLKDLGFTGSGPDGCFLSVGLGNFRLEPYEVSLLNGGGIVVQTPDGQYKALVHYDPSVYVSEQKAPHQAVVMTPQGLKFVDRKDLKNQHYSEIFQSPIDGHICGRSENSLATPRMNSEFWLPQIN